MTRVRMEEKKLLAGSSPLPLRFGMSSEGDPATARYLVESWKLLQLQDRGMRAGPLKLLGGAAGFFAIRRQRDSTLLSQIRCWRRAFNQTAEARVAGGMTAQRLVQDGKKQSWNSPRTRSKVAGGTGTFTFVECRCAGTGHGRWSTNTRPPHNVGLIFFLLGLI
jgi:hypothetical protein